MGSKVCFFVLYAEFIPDIFSVSLNRLAGRIQHVCDLFGGFALLHKICHLDLCRGKVQISGQTCSSSRGLDFDPEA